MFFKTQLSYGVAVFQWLTSSHKNRMTTRVITVWRVHVTSLTMSLSTMRFLNEIMFILKAIFHSKVSYDEQNPTPMVISYEIYDTCQKLVSYEMIMNVIRSSIYAWWNFCLYKLEESVCL